jgi:ABC-type multidrug transport system fused ATPase/permease subunit
MQHMSRSENAFGIASAVCDHAPQISFDNISFAYPGKDFLIDHLTLSVAQGEKVCLVGRSGVGKTTMLRLLLSFLSPTHGCIRMDGVDINDFADKNAYRQYFGVVSQDDILFNISLRDNLVFGLSTEPHDEQIYDVLERVGLRDDVWKLPQRLETLYAEHSLSGGQKQRFVVARALLRKPRIILLDEPTSALDFENEDKVLMAIDHLVGTRTAISVAHRLSTVRAADRIAVLGEGRVVATGSHEELLETSVYYQRLCKFNSFIL